MWWGSDTFLYLLKNRKITMKILLKHSKNTECFFIVEKLLKRLHQNDYTNVFREKTNKVMNKQKFY